MNTPNKITLLRLFMIPFMIFFYLATFIPYGKFIAFIIFIVACSTDFLDGYLARKNNQVTDLGKFLDPIADKVLVMSALLLIVVDRMILYPLNIIIAIIILAREFIVSALRQIAVTKNIVIAADKWGKYKTVFQDVALVFYMFMAFVITENIFNGTALVVFDYISLSLICLATLLTIISGVNYVVKNRQVFK